MAWLQTNQIRSHVRLLLNLRSFYGSLGTSTQRSIMGGFFHGSPIKIYMQSSAVIQSGRHLCCPHDTGTHYREHNIHTSSVCRKTTSKKKLLAAVSQLEVVIPSSSGCNRDVNNEKSDDQFSSNNTSVSYKRNNYVTTDDMLDVDMHDKASGAPDINNIQRSDNNAPTEIDNDCSRVVSKCQRETDADIVDYEDIDSVADVLQQSGYEVRVKTIKPKPKLKPLTVHRNITIKALAAAMNKPVSHIYNVLDVMEGVDPKMKQNDEITDTMILKDICNLSGFRMTLQEVKKKVERPDLNAYPRPLADPSKLQKRPPVVTIMGHVDHGKTTLLDAIRSSNIVDGEFGGITQHIGAFSVNIGADQITFLDTPGHAAFSAMRGRGANVTDIVVLVVAADDGVMEQTAESIKHAQLAGVSIIVAINKIDKHGVDIEYTKRSLLSHGVQLEESGGTIQAVEVSALKGTNLDSLKEAILAEAELLELKAEYSGKVEGSIIESRKDAGKGKIATALIQRGTISKGNIIVAGKSWGKVRTLLDERGQTMTEVTPGNPVEISGWKELPHPGDELLQVESESRASEVINWRLEQEAIKKVEVDSEVIRKNAEIHHKAYSEQRKVLKERGYRYTVVFKRNRESETTDDDGGPQLPIVIKGDVDGSIEAILDSLSTYKSDQCKLDILQHGIGAPTMNDIDMASSFNGIIYAFNVDTPASIYQAAEMHGVEIRAHNVIYKMFDDLKQEMTERLPPKIEEDILGEATVQQLFYITDRRKKRPVAGCKCSKGTLFKRHRFKLMRKDELLYDGEASHLRHHKNDVDSIRTDVECGICLSDISVIPEPGDVLICYTDKEVEQTIDWDLYYS